MSTPESKVKRAVKTLLSKYPGLYANWPVPGGYGTPMLDCVGCYHGKFFMIETKAEGEDLTPRQRLTVDEVTAAGGWVFVVTGSGDRSPKSWLGWMSLELWLNYVRDEVRGE